MSFRGFLYRRLCPVVTCELRPEAGGLIPLASKYALASVADVFLHPFYWQLYALLSAPPRLVVDLGAHHGHFTMLADICIKARFGRSTADHVLVEANPALMPALRRAMTAYRPGRSTAVVHGAVGLPAGAGRLYMNRHNPLATGTDPVAGRAAVAVPTVRTVDVLPAGRIGILKIDIEGSEYGLLAAEPELFDRAELVLLELHGTDRPAAAEFRAALDARGLVEVVPPAGHNGHLLLALANRRLAAAGPVASAGTTGGGA